MTTPGEARLDMDRVQEALSQAQAYVASHDAAEARRAQVAKPRPSALQTMLDHAGQAAERVMQYLNGDAATLPPGGRDGGPL